MKELIYRDIYLIRKSLLITLGIFAGMIGFGFIMILSAKYGNIAKYSFDNLVPEDVMRAALYFAIVAGLMLSSGVEHITGIVNKDYKSGWHQYLVTTGIRPEIEVGVKYLITFAIFVIGVLVGVFGFSLMAAVSGINDTNILSDSLGKSEGFLILVLSALFLLMAGNYFTMIEYLYKGKNSKKADMIRGIPVVIIISLAMGIFLYLGAMEEKLKEVIEVAKTLGHHTGLTSLVSILFGIIFTFGCYMISVKLVKNERKRV